MKKWSGARPLRVQSGGKGQMGSRPAAQETEIPSPTIQLNGIGLPEKRIHEIEPLEIPVPSVVPDFIPEWMLPDEEKVPA